MIIHRQILMLTLILLSINLNAQDFNCSKYFLDSDQVREPFANSLEKNLQQKLWSLSGKEKNIERVKFEEDLIQRLRSEEVKSQTVIESGNSRPILLEFKSGIKGIFKNNQDDISSSSSEIAAYEIDKLFHFDFVPLTIEKVYKGESGSLQLFVEDAKSLRVLSKSTSFELSPAQRGKLEVFDYLLLNIDRGKDNTLLTLENQLIAIDHGVALRLEIELLAEDALTQDALSFFKTTKGKEVISSMKSVSKSDLKNSLSDYLHPKTLEAFYMRKKEVEKFFDNLKLD